MLADILRAARKKKIATSEVSGALSSYVACNEEAMPMASLASCTVTRAPQVAKKRSAIWT